LKPNSFKHLKKKYSSNSCPPSKVKKIVGSGNYNDEIRLIVHFQAMGPEMSLFGLCHYLSIGARV